VLQFVFQLEIICCSAHSQQIQQSWHMNENDINKYTYYRVKSMYLLLAKFDAFSSALVHATLRQTVGLFRAELLGEWILNCTSAKLDYTVPFTLVHAGKYRTEDWIQIKNRHTTKTKHNPDKANNAKYSKTKLAWFSRLVRHSTRKRGGLILQRCRAHTGLMIPGSHFQGHSELHTQASQLKLTQNLPKATKST